METSSTKTPSAKDLLEQYEQGLDVTFPTTPQAAYERRLIFDHALTVGTRDGATIEMAREAGEENIFLFGLTAEEVLASRGWYNPHWHYQHEPDLRYALDMIRDNAFSHAEQGVFTPIWDALLTHGDHYMHLADLSAYARAHENGCFKRTLRNERRHHERAGC